jgi:23S rRNA pseudouridine1911/1915/1917 synthase
MNQSGAPSTDGTITEQRRIGPEEGGRLDSYLLRSLPGMSRRMIRRRIDEGRIEVNGRPARKGQHVFPGDVIRFPGALLSRRANLRPQPDLRVKVLLEDPDCLALDKPAGMATVALDADDTDTLANFLVARFPETAAAGRSPLEAGLVHRLDHGTSGVVLAARNREAYDRLRRQFTDRRVYKEYWAIVRGDCATARRIQAPIGNVPGHPDRMRVLARAARGRKQREALTEVKPRERFGNATLLEIVIETGVRHQIRVHVASIGHPVVGDDLYGGEGAASADRPLLHARRVRFRHPRTGAPISVVAPPPADFRSAVAHLRTRSTGPLPPGR